MGVSPLQTVKNITEEKDISDAPPRKWCEVRRWAADNAYLLFFLSFNSLITWGLIITDILRHP